MRKGLTPAAFAVLVVWAELACGQDPRGTILGRVTDSSNAVVPGVEVRVTNVATGVTASGVANEGGSYNIPFLLPGTYRIRAEIPGFKTYVRDGIQVRVSETVELNIQMEVGQISETVIATAETPLLDTAGSSLGQVVDERRVLELPLFAGNPMELTLLTPGVVNTTDMRLRKAAFNNAPSQIATDGNGQYNNEFQIDGVSNTFAVGNGTARVAFSPPATAIKEFKIETSPYDASVGHTIGAVTNVSTAGGTNELHGEAHFWVRQDKTGLYPYEARVEPVPGAPHEADAPLIIDADTVLPFPIPLQGFHIHIFRTNRPINIPLFRPWHQIDQTLHRHKGCLLTHSGFPSSGPKSVAYSLKFAQLEDSRSFSTSIYATYEMVDLSGFRSISVTTLRTA